MSRVIPIAFTPTKHLLRDSLRREDRGGARSFADLPDQGDSLGAGGNSERGVQRRKRQSFSPRQFQIGGIIDRQPMDPGETKKHLFIHPIIELDREAPEDAERAIARAGVEPATPLVDDEHVADLEPPDARDECMIMPQARLRDGGNGMRFVWQEPAGGDRRIHDKWHQYLCPS